MDRSTKNVGFKRNIRLAWLDAAATAASETNDSVEVRARLDPVVGEEIASAENRRKAIDILVNIWLKTRPPAPGLHEEAVARFGAAANPTDRLWLHYGLTLLYYPFFRDAVAAIGQLARFGDAVTSGMVKGRLVAGRGQLGSLDKAAERVVFSLRDWGILVPTEHRSAYRPAEPALAASDTALEAWLLACVLRAHPAQELPAADLLRLPELFPFRLTLTTETLRRCPHLEVQRQGSGWDTVRSKF